MKQFTGMKWLNEKPYLMLYNFDNNDYELEECAGYLKLEKSATKLCNGYYDLINHKYMPCKEKASGEEYSQCLNCQELSGFSRCLSCHGIECHNNDKKAREFCNQPHLIYIAVFGDNKLKVGTAAEYRRDVRLLEQGAVFSAYIGKTPNGRLARLLENIISKSGITQMVNPAYKIKNLPIIASESEIRKIINELYHNIKEKCPKYLIDYLINPEFNFYHEINDFNKKMFTEEESQLSLFDEPKIKIKEYKIDSNPSIIEGKVLNVVGTIIVMQNEKEVIACDTKKMEGYLVSFEKQ